MTQNTKKQLQCKKKYKNILRIQKQVLILCGNQGKKPTNDNTIRSSTIRRCASPVACYREGCDQGAEQVHQFLFNTKLARMDIKQLDKAAKILQEIKELDEFIIKLD